MDILRAREPSQDNDLMKIQLREYMEFIQTFTTEVDIMTKNFFVVIPYTPSAIDLKGGRSSITGLLPNAKKKQSAFDPTRFAEDRSQLEQRIAVVEQGLSRIGVRTALLGNEELIELYYHIFNPEDMSKAPTR